MAMFSKITFAKRENKIYIKDQGRLNFVVQVKATWGIWGKGKKQDVENARLR